MNAEIVNPLPGARAKHPHDASPFLLPGPLLIWLLLQWGALALAALRVPLAAEYPQPAEAYAVALLLAVQFPGSALLFPMLYPRWEMTLATIASACVLLAVAAALAGWALGSVIPAMGLLAIWMTALYLWRGAFASRGQSAIAGCATAYVLGGALLWYFNLEANAGGDVAAPISNGPLPLILPNPQSPPAAAWWCVLVLLAGGITVRLLALGWAWQQRRSRPR